MITTVSQTVTDKEEGKVLQNNIKEKHKGIQCWWEWKGYYKIILLILITAGQHPVIHL